jgi:hypothetical protein
MDAEQWWNAEPGQPWEKGYGNGAWIVYTCAWQDCWDIERLE